MTGRDLISWIQDNKAENLEVCIQGRDGSRRLNHYEKLLDDEIYLVHKRDMMFSLYDVEVDDDNKDINAILL